MRVRISGAITRTATSGLTEFCSLERWADACASAWAEIVAETPIPPSGATFVGGAGAAIVAWEAGDPISPSEGSSLTLDGPAGGELWAGRREWGCYYFDSQQLQGPCFVFGGGYTVTVEVDDGGTPPDSAISEGGDGGGGGTPDARLRASAILSGGSVHLVATATEGAVIQNPRWAFIPDEVTTVEGDTTAPGAPVAVASATRGRQGRNGGGTVPEALRTRGLHWGPSVDHALTEPAGRPTTAASAPNGAPPVSISDCDESADCVTSAPPSSGTYVVVATVDGQLLSASARAGTAPAASLVLVCPTNGVRRGDPGTCIATVSPVGATLAVTGWFFDPDDPGLPPVERAANKTATDWPGDHLVASGTVTVTGSVNGAPGTASAHLSVVSRRWTGDMIPVEAPVPTDDGDMSEQPAPSKDEDGIWDLGHIHYSTSEYDIPGTLVLVGGGPNGGYGYFSEVPVVPVMTVHINYSQLNANSNLAQLQRTAAAAFDSESRCLRNQLEAQIAPIALHEGTKMHEKSHAGRFAAAYTDLAAPVVEQIVMGSQSSPTSALDDVLAPIFDQAVALAGEADDDFKAQVTCNIKLFPAR